MLGLMAGLGLCAGLFGAMRSVLYGVGVYDWRTLLGVALLLVSVMVVATVAPSLRIAGIDPARALREE